jgi:hypothetical protein
LRTTTAFPYHVHEIENVWIPLSDGTHLAARLWLPEGAEAQPVPAILEYIPYRKRDITRERDDLTHAYFAGHGYACVRVDIRGSGDSEGVLADEYLPQEQADGIEVLRWIAAQPWCNGSVGMIGISWGGFNGLQIAAHQPPELKTIITLSSTDDRYADDIHYMGGCLLGDNQSWAATMFAYNSCPPDPAIFGEQWREQWFQRLQHNELWMNIWLEHQWRDTYWRQGSVCEDFSAITCPVFAVSGWADGYSNAVFRLLANLDVPRKGLIGPWGHKYPHLGVPGPAIGFLQEALRWWDTWLKGEDTGIMDEPMLRVWMQQSVPPTTSYQYRPGYWVGETQWPSPRLQQRTLVFTPGWMVPPEEALPEVPLTIQSPLSVGLFAGKWCSFSATPDLPHDQREEDGGALVFDSSILTEQIEILGSPVVELEFMVNKPVAMVAVRLSDVAPDGRATRVTYGLQNLTHRHSHAQPRPLEPDTRYHIQVKLNEIAQVFPAGHRLRISVSTSYWPIAWPPPEPTMLTVFTHTSQLTLPIRPANSDDARLHEFAPSEGAPSPAKTIVQPRHYEWLVKRDLARDVSTLEVVKDEGTIRFDEIDLELTRSTTEWYTYQNDSFSSVRGETLCVRGFRRGAWNVETITRTILSSDAKRFMVHADLDAFEDGRRVYTRSWSHEVPRDCL